MGACTSTQKQRPEQKQSFPQRKSIPLLSYETQHVSKSKGGAQDHEGVLVSTQIVPPANRTKAQICGSNVDSNASSFIPAQIAPGNEPATGAARPTGGSDAGDTSAADSSGGIGSTCSSHDTQKDDKIMVEDSLMQCINLPYNVFESGPYTPACEKERVAYSDKLNLMESEPDAQIARILTAVATVFDSSSVLLTLCGKQRVWIRNAIGFSAGDFPWRWAFCGWSLAPPIPTVLAIEDTHRDARFHDNLVVTGEPHIRHFAGAPLVASNNHRLGTLSFLGPRPRQFSAQEMVILINLAELVVRELEKQTAIASANASSAPSDEAMYLNRSLQCFTHQSVLLMDTQQNLWKTIYCNETFCEETVSSYEGVMKVPFWELFQPPYDIGSEAWDASEDMVRGGGEFVVRGCTISGRPGYQYTLSFRPAGRASLDADAQPVGVPSDVPSLPETSCRYYFCTLSKAKLEAQASLIENEMAAVVLSMPALEPPIESLTLGALLGKGSYGYVYRGTYRGGPVAVKVCEKALTNSRGKRLKPWAGVEAMRALELDHPGIVRTLKHTSVLLKEGTIISTHSDSPFGQSTLESTPSGWEDEEWFDEGDPHNPTFDSSRFGNNNGSEDGGGESSGMHQSNTAIVEMQTWAILEYCDMGTLQSGVDKGLFRKERTCKPPSEPNMEVVLVTAAQLASAISYLHENDIVHGDLAGGNVLLLEEASQPHGFSCKVSDFGLSRDMGRSTAVETRTYGTVTHMPPELLTSGSLTKAADSYAFGIILWEICHGVRPHNGLTHTQVLAAVAIDKKRLQFAPSIDARVAALGERCMSFDPAERPTFPQIEAELEELKQKRSVMTAGEKTTLPNSVSKNRGSSGRNIMWYRGV